MPPIKKGGFPTGSTVVLTGTVRRLKRPWPIDSIEIIALKFGSREGGSDKMGLIPSAAAVFNLLGAGKWELRLQTGSDVGWVPGTYYLTFNATDGTDNVIGFDQFTLIDSGAPIPL